MPPYESPFREPTQTDLAAPSDTRPGETSDVAFEQWLGLGFGTCPPASYLFAVHQGILSVDVDAEVEDHIRECNVCQALLQAEQTLLDQHSNPPLLTPDHASQLFDRITQSISDGEAAQLQFHTLANPRVNSRLWRSLAIAATVLLATGIGTLAVRHHSATDSIVAHSPKDAVVPKPFAMPPEVLAELTVLKPLAPPSVGAPEMTLRGDSSNSADEPPGAELLAAFRAYTQHDYETAAKAFQALGLRYPNSRTPFLYLGVTELELNHNSEAATTLDQLKNRSTNASGAILWYLAVAKARLNDPSAVPLFRALCAAKDDQSMRGFSFPRQSCTILVKLP